MAAKNTGKISFERPKPDDQTDEALDKFFEQNEEKGIGKDPDTGAGSKQSSEGSESNMAGAAAPGKKVSNASKRVSEGEKGENMPAAESGLDINQILSMDVEDDGWVTRNFRIRRSHMNKIKALTAKANSLGKRSTQDEIISEIFADWFKIKNQ